MPSKAFLAPIKGVTRQVSQIKGRPVPDDNPNQEPLVHVPLRTHDGKVQYPGFASDEWYSLVQRPVKDWRAP